MVERITIKEIQEIVSDISKELNEDSVLYEDFTWFSTNKYTVPSEYNGELLLFIKKIKNNVEVSSYKDELTILENKLESFFG